MNARDVLDGLKAAEWKRTYSLPGRPKLCPVCGGMFGEDPEECGHDEGCAIASAIQWFEEHVGAEAARRDAEHCDHRLCKQWGDAEGNCNCPCTPCRDADSNGRHRALVEHA